MDRRKGGKGGGLKSSAEIFFAFFVSYILVLRHTQLVSLGFFFFFNPVMEAFLFFVFFLFMIKGESFARKSETGFRYAFSLSRTRFTMNV